MDRLQHSDQVQRALFAISELAVSSSDMAEVLRGIHAIVDTLMYAENFYIVLRDPAHDTIELLYFADVQDPVPFQGQLPMEQFRNSYTWHVLHGRRALRGNAERLSTLVDGPLHGVGTDSVDWLGVPILRDGEALGAIVVQSYTSHDQYTAADQELLSFVASQIATSLLRLRAADFLQQAYAQREERVAERTAELRQQIQERERIQQRLHHEVLHDALTGLPNRGHLHRRINEALLRVHTHPGRLCALLYLDVDRFKVINDSLGHLAGDEFLRQIARRLTTCVREPDLVARLAGDEFVILLEEVVLDGSGRPSGAISVARRVIETLGKPLTVAGHTLEPSASIGIAVADTRYRQTDDLVRDADMALYQAKAQGGRRWELFDDSRPRAAVDELTVEAELRLALRRDELEPYFQPIVRLSDGEVVGHEALMRWNHPRRGVLRPADFLAVAQDSGVIEAMDWRIFKRAFTLAARLGGTSYLSINVSPRHLLLDDFASRLLGLLERTGLDPSRLLIEVTEGTLLDNPERARLVLQALLAQGVGVALDDFGTGYSSLSYLHTFPLRVLKIDRTFLAALDRQDNSAAVITAVLALARALGMKVVGEGIESDEQHAELLALGCEYGQGYLFGRPRAVRPGRAPELQPA